MSLFNIDNIDNTEFNEQWIMFMIKSLLNIVTLMIMSLLKHYGNSI
jgi:hypothetical protein